MSKTALAGALRAIGIGLLLGFHILIGRSFGADGLGTFSIAYAVANALAIVCGLGIDNAVLRRVSGVVATGKTGIILRTLAKQACLIAFIGVIGCVSVWLSAPWLAAHVFEAESVSPHLRILSAAIPLVALLSMCAHALRGLGWVAGSQFVHVVVPPAIALFFLLAARNLLDLSAASMGFVAGNFLALLIGITIIVRSIPRKNGKAESPESLSHLVQESLRFYPVSLALLAAAWLPLMLLGMWAEVADVGRFQAALQLASLVGFVLTAINLVAAPQFARLHARQRSEVLSALVYKVTLLCGTIALAMTVLLVPMAPRLLGLFGADFGGYTLNVFLIILVGQVFNLAVGPTGSLLMMTHNERDIRNLSVGGVILMVGISMALIPAHQAVGAALALTAMMLFSNIGGVLAIRRRLGFWVFKG